MINFEFGNRFRNCSGISRRTFLSAGSSGIAGISLPMLLANDAIAGQAKRPKSLILIHLDGGPPQMDLIDPKPQAPSEVRSPFSPISTNVPGIHLTDLMPQCSTIADRLVFLRWAGSRQSTSAAGQACQLFYQSSFSPQFGPAQPDSRVDEQKIP